MTVTWQMLADRDDPVVGDPANFERVHGHLHRSLPKVREVREQLAAIRFGRADFTGQAAQTFVTQLAAVDNQVDDLGDVTEQLRRVFEDHLERLRELRAATDKALAEAQTAWRERDLAETQRRAADARVTELERQLASLTDEDGGVQRSVLEDRRRVAARDQNDARQAETRAINTLNSYREVWRTQHRQSTDLIAATVAGLEAVHLGSLANPNLLQQVWARIENIDLLGFLKEIWETVLDSLAVLNALIDSISKVLAIVGAVCAILALIPVLTPFFGPVAAFAFKVVLVLTVVKAINSVILAGSGRISWSDAAVDIAVAVFALVTAGLAKVGTTIAAGNQPVMNVIKSKLFVGQGAVKLSLAKQIPLALHRTERLLDVVGGIESGFSLGSAYWFGSGSIPDRFRSDAIYSGMRATKDPFELPSCFQIVPWRSEAREPHGPVDRDMSPSTSGSRP